MCAGRLAGVTGALLLWVLAGCDTLAPLALPEVDARAALGDGDGDGWRACAPGEECPAGAFDCDDHAAFSYPGAREICDGQDNDCDRTADEDLAVDSYYVDADADGYGTGAGTPGCSAPSGHSVLAGDCDDRRPQTNPGMPETCNGRDDDCDGLVDEDAPPTDWYPDEDGDGFGDASSAAVSACAQPAGYRSNNGDCNDADEEVYPGAEETCTDTRDYDCDGVVASVDADGDGAPKCQDCDDGADTVRPGAAEVCDGIDNNCDTLVDNARFQVWYRDADGDGYGDEGVVDRLNGCANPGWALRAGGCDDGAATVFPGNAELCDALDNDCDGLVDEDLPEITYHPDEDGDGFGDPTEATTGCTPPDGYVDNGLDCADSDGEQYPGATESCEEDLNCDGSFGDADADGDGVRACDDCDDADADRSPAHVEECDGKDNDCNLKVDDEIESTWYRDADGDGYGINSQVASLPGCTVSGWSLKGNDCDDGDASIWPGAPEQCDGIDNDCDKAVPALELDADKDGFRGCPEGARAADCDDGDRTAYPGARETPGDDVDSNCDGNVDRVITVAGTGAESHGGDGGSATRANLDTPSAVALDTGGNTYIADLVRHRIRRVTPDGIIATVAGNGLAGFGGDGGAAIDAALQYPYGVAVGASGDLYVADLYNYRIRRVRPDGVIVTLAGTGTRCLRTGDPATSICPGEGGPATLAQISDPYGLAVGPDGSLYIAQPYNNLVYKVDPGGDLVRAVGSGVCCQGQSEGAASEIGLDAPQAVALDVEGNLYIADDTAVWKVRAADGWTVRLAGAGVRNYDETEEIAQEASFCSAAGVAVDAEQNVYVSDVSYEACVSSVVRRIDADGFIATVAGTGSDGYSGDGGAATTSALARPMGLAVDATGRLLIADQLSNRVRRVVVGGTITTVAGNGACCFVGDDGPATSAELGFPANGEIDPDGRLLFSEVSGDRLRRIALDGRITTLAGNDFPVFSGDEGPASEAQLASPYGSGVAPDGTIFLADSGNNRIRAISPDGTIRTAAGTGATGFGNGAYSGDGGPATLARLNAPFDVVAAENGDLYIADYVF